MGQAVLVLSEVEGCGPIITFVFVTPGQLVPVLSKRNAFPSRES
jgi:hypothetical protein